MIEREIALKPVIKQIRVIRGQLLGQKHALVDDRPAGQGADIELTDTGAGDRILDLPTNDIEIALEIIGADPFTVTDHDLFNLGPGCLGLLADHLVIHRHLTPAIDAVTEFENLGLNQRPAQLLRIVIGTRQEDHADGEIVIGRLLAGTGHLLMEKGLWHLNMDTGTIAGLAIGIHSPAVIEHLERLNPGNHHITTRCTIKRGDKADTAG